MRIVSEPAPPLDAHGELVLDQELLELAETLVADAQHLSCIAEVSDLAAQLHREAASLGALGGLSEGVTNTAGAASASWRVDKPRSRNGWRQVWRVAPLAAAVLLVCFWAVPSTPPQRTTTIHLDSTPATVTHPASAPLRDAATRDAAQVIPWQELTSPELEGALDLVDESVSISI